MKKYIVYTFVLFFTTGFQILYAQHHRCGTMQKWEQRVQQNSSLLTLKQRNEVATQQWLASNSTLRGNSGIITIPVVVHVIYNTNAQNISDKQILSQIAVLNEDFRKLNKDSLRTQHPFYTYTADCKIEFCLAQQDPNGKATTGITRTSTSVKSWDDTNEDDIKSTANGGHDNWDPTKYLNIWVANLVSTYVGFATFPDEMALNPELDGVVIACESFGRVGTAGTGNAAENDMGRTATHEIGHWLNLNHIWGDAQCGDDLVWDTEPAEGENYGNPTFPWRPKNKCGSSSNGEMYMNYMDYVDDSCMKMFTAGQASRMKATLNGLRSGLLTSKGCVSTTSVIDALNNHIVSIFPNPSTGKFSITINSSENAPTKISIVDVMGNIVYDAITISNNRNSYDLSNLANGIYILVVSNHAIMTTHKIIIAQ